MTNLEAEKPKSQLRYSRIFLAFIISFCAVLLLEILEVRRLNILNLAKDFFVETLIRFMIGLPTIFVLYKLLNRKEFTIGLSCLFLTWAVFAGWLGAALFGGGS